MFFPSFYDLRYFRFMLKALPDIIQMTRKPDWHYTYCPLFTHHKHRPKKGKTKHKVRARKVSYGKR